MKHPEAAAQYMDSIHGRALLKMGLIVAPSCNDCHGVHDIKRAVDRDSPINHANVAKTCGKCHLGIEETYNQSIHGQLLAKGDPRGPGLHRLPHRARNRESRRARISRRSATSAAASATRTGWQHYRDTYHGKAMALGRPNVAPEVAACYDCHGYHDVLPPSDPRVAPFARPTSWPPASNAIPAPPPASPNTSRTPIRWTRRHYPLLHAVFLGMTGLLIGMFAFFGLHTVGWLVRAVYLYLHDSKKFREAKIKTQKDDEWFTRFVAVRAVPAFPGGDQLPAAGHHRHAAEILLYRTGPR